jgi:hypothetical protein
MNNQIKAGLYAGFLLIPISITGFSGGNVAPSNESTEIESVVTLVRKDAEKKVEVLVDGELFTAYLFSEKIAKPVLFPIKSVNGSELTRGFPLDPRPGERVDHPHHVGLWLNYGDVNGLDFWNNSDAIPEDKRAGYGSIVHRKINRMSDGNGKAELEVTMDWIGPDGKVLLQEHTIFIFRANGDKRMIDRITKLTAQGNEVSFKDNKEGMLGIRVARELEHPSDKPEIFTDASGKSTAVPSLNNEGVTGHYRSSEGIERDDVWGTRGSWLNLSGVIKGEKVSIAILDHPKNVGYPTYWHARGYGLFAANPLGQKAMSGGKEELNCKLEAGESLTFNHRIVIYSGVEATDEMLNKEYSEFTLR